MALVVVIGEVTSARVMVGERTAKGTSGLSESCGQSESVVSDRWSDPGTQFSVLNLGAVLRRVVGPGMLMGGTVRLWPGPRK